MATKSQQLVARLTQRAGNQHKTIFAASWALLQRLAVEETRASGVFLLPGIGKIVLDRRKARTGRNPQTGQPLLIPPKTTLRFRFAKTFKEAVMPLEASGSGTKGKATPRVSAGQRPLAGARGRSGTRPARRR